MKITLYQSVIEWKKKSNNNIINFTLNLNSLILKGKKKKTSNLVVQINWYTSKFSVYISEYMKLKCSLHLKRLKYSDRPDRSLWTDSDLLIKTIKALIKTES
ncbi:hypothetical protein RIR_jg39201.t1 [Rhizophagus irregularis DAOM 181602=DAOM 197198]|nr:hypothetical protein RIR_jg39201.t1 [Rhizophagus irregularis DAOM 181602=DAOM 197198]